MILASSDASICPNKKKGGAQWAPPWKAWLVLVQLAVRGGEQRVDAATEQAGADGDHDGDECDEQAVLHHGGALLAVEAVGDERGQHLQVSHGDSLPCVSEARPVRPPLR